MPIKIGIVLYRNGEPVTHVAWNSGFTDMWIGHFLLMKRQLPYAWDPKAVFAVCWVSKDILSEMAELLTERRIDICHQVWDCFEPPTSEEVDAAAQIGEQLRRLVEEYREGDECHYYSDD